MSLKSTVLDDCNEVSFSGMVGRKIIFSLLSGRRRVQNKTGTNGEELTGGVLLLFEQRNL